MLVKKVLIDRTDRLYQMPPDILDFARPILGKLVLPGPDLIDLGTFDWPTVEESGLSMPATLRPATSQQIQGLKEALADWLTEYHGAHHIGPREIYLGNGISSLALLVSLTFIDTGDIALVPSLSVPLYRKTVTAAAGVPIPYPLSSRNRWLPDVDKMSSRLGKIARVLFINSPHNPTGAELDDKLFANLVNMAARENTLLINDACYQSVPARKPLSLLSIDGGRKVGLELYSFSYLLGLPPMPFGFAVGHRHLIASLEAAGTLLPTFAPSAFVDAAMNGLRQFPSKALLSIRKQFAATSAAATPLLEGLGLESVSPATVPFIWARIPRRRNSVAFARMLLRRHRILVVPGTGFGDVGQGYVRLSLTAPRHGVAEAASRVTNRRRITRHKESS